jgi:hypothetical protein
MNYKKVKSLLFQFQKNLKLKKVPEINESIVPTLHCVRCLIDSRLDNQFYYSFSDFGLSWKFSHCVKIWIIWD